MTHEGGSESIRGRYRTRFETVAVPYAFAVGTEGGEAAERLGVGTSRIRQRIGERTLYAVKSGRSWRLPAWQFTRRGEMTGIAAVIHAFPSETDLVEVDGFLTSPNVDLVVDDVAVTPLEWLGAGHNPEPVIRIAADL